MKVFRTLVLAGLVAVSAGSTAFAREHDGRDNYLIREGLPDNNTSPSGQALEGRASAYGAPPAEVVYGNRTHGRTGWRQPFHFDRSNQE